MVTRLFNHRVGLHYLETCRLVKGEGLQVDVHYALIWI